MQTAATYTKQNICKIIFSLSSAIKSYLISDIVN